MRFLKVLLVLVLALVLSPVAVPRVKAQATSITSLQAPPTAKTGTNATVVVTATYDLGPNGSAVSIGIADRDSIVSPPWANGTAQSSKNTCHVVTEQAFCIYIPKSAFGSDVVTFQLQLSQGRTYRLRVAVELYYANTTLISSASSFRDFSIVFSATGPQGPTTQILAVDYYPANVTSGGVIFIVATVSYSGGIWLWANLIDLRSMQRASGSVSATPACSVTNGSTCEIPTYGGSGNATFTWSFSVFLLVSYSGNVSYAVQTYLTSNSSPTPVKGSGRTYTVSIPVVYQSLTSFQAQTSTQPQVSTTHSSATTSPPQSTSQPANNALVVALAVVAAAILGLILLSRRRKKIKEPTSRKLRQRNPHERS